MGLYRARDLLRVPGLLSLSRIPLAAAFAFSVTRPPLALAILAVAGFSDVLDGWYARRYGQVTPTGAAIDPVTDKVFVLTVAVTLVATQALSPTELLLLSTRELGELPLVTWVALSPRARRSRAANASANLPGKLATLLQFATVAAALFHASILYAMILGTAAAGLLAAIVYWVRAISDVRGEKTAL
jgi:cardiolipin synthase (CMP-forming)